MVTMITIEIIKNIDVPEIGEFCTKSIMEQQIYQLGLSFNLTKMLSEVHDFAINPEKILIAAKDDDKIAGVILGEQFFYPFTDTKIVSQKFLRVEPKYRGKGISSEMTKALILWGKKTGCKFISAGVHEYACEEVQKSYDAMKKIGFKDFGRNYYMEIK